jgi:O-antigen/teichoic acid export membrane protein
MIKKIKNSIYNLLIKTQKFTGTDNIYVATHGSFLSIGNIINSLASFLLAMAFAKLLPREIYGQYRYILSIMAIVGITALSGMESAIIQATARGFEGGFKKILKTKFRWAMLGSFACLLIGAYFLLFGHNINISVSFFIATIFFPVMETSASYLSYLTGKKLFGTQVKYSTLAQIISTVFIIITLFLTKNLIILVMVYFLSNSALRTYFLLKTLKKYPPNENYDPTCIPFGKHMTVMDIVLTISGQLDKIMLFNFLGATQVAIFSFVELPVREINSFLRNLRLLALPKLSAKTKSEIKETLLKKVEKSFLFIVPIIAIYIVLAPYFYKIFFPEYMESVFYSQLFVLTLLAFPATILNLTFEAKMMKKQLYQITVFSPLVRIFFLLLLVPNYGILGVIIAQLLSRVFDIILALVLFKKI